MMNKDDSDRVLSFENAAWSPVSSPDWQPNFDTDHQTFTTPEQRVRFFTSTPHRQFLINPITRDPNVPQEVLYWPERVLQLFSTRRDQDNSALIDPCENSQGYQFFFDSSFNNGVKFNRIWRHFLSVLYWVPRRVREEWNNRMNHSDQLDCEIPRGNPDLIDLSEFFPSSRKPSVVFPEYKISSSTMSSIYRSEPMRLCQMILVKDAAYDCVGEIGKYNNVQFNDLNAGKNVFQRTFVQNVRRCEELERKLRFLEKQVVECNPGVKLQPIDASIIETPSHQEINNLETKLDELEKDFVELNRNDSLLRKNLNEMVEFEHVIERVEEFFQVHLEDEAMNNIEDADVNETFHRSIGSGGFNPSNDVPLTPLCLGGKEEVADNAWFIAGTIPQDKKSTFERVLWRACRRTAFVRIGETTVTIEDPVTLAPIVKCVFIVFFKGESLKLIIDKVCDGFCARQYPCPKTSKERQTARFDIIARTEDLKIVIESTKNHRFQILEQIAKDLPVWLKKVHIQKSIYHTLNMFTVDTNGFLAAECWIPDNEIDNVKAALHKGLQSSGGDVSPILNEMSTTLAPPTYNKTNKFTKVFQSIVDSYGIAKYREINPSPFTIISFPFLFAVMFGDAAHGFILFLTGLFFILNEKKIVHQRIRDEIFNTFFGGRYIILLMGIFSIYTGIIYNDAFAKSFNLWESSWKNPYNRTDISSWLSQRNQKMLLTLDPSTGYSGQPYAFGVDPIWNIAENRLSFLNSMKMKVSVILGVLQMTFGVILSFLNHSFFKSKVDIFTNFIPQIIFLGCIFIYLCFQMIVKWIFFSVHPGIVLGLSYPGTNCAPSLLIGLINMFMLKERPIGYIDTNGTQYSSCYLNQWYPNQSLVEMILLCCAIGCVPIMLIGKPLAVYLNQKSTKKAAGIRSVRNTTTRQQSEDVEQLLDSIPNHEHSVGDAIVHQAIHTIEFVLGCVSHTASYLRLWALSLAHAQLSEVLWHMVLMSGMSFGEGGILGYVAAYLVFFVFGILSLSILVMMEGLSAFLHALRLHWVEFQSKFYQGTGYIFHPYSLQTCLETAQHLSEVTEEDHSS